jgi:hypothetical protein
MLEYPAGRVLKNAATLAYSRTLLHYHMRNIINFLLRIAKSARGLTNHYLSVTRCKFCCNIKQEGDWVGRVQPIGWKALRVWAALEVRRLGVG